MRRSLLFIPGNNPAMLQTATLFSADTIIIDLEDAVSITQKDSARILVREYLKSNPTNTEIAIRINGYDTPFYLDDLNEIVSDNIDSIMVPKARYEDLISLSDIITKIEENKKLNKTIKFIPIIEMAISLLEVDKIATHPRVDGLLLGAEDLTSDMETKRTEAGNEIQYPRAKVAMAAIAYKIDAIDTPYTNVNNDEGLIRDANIALGLGMNAKACIHPRQVPTINEIYSPSIEAISEAEKIIAAAKEAEAKNLGVFSVGGKMIDKPIIERSEKILKKKEKFDL